MFYIPDVEAVMIKDVVFEGNVVKVWKYTQATSRSSASWMGCTKEVQADIKDIEAYFGQRDTGVKTSPQLSQNALTNAQAYIR